MKTMKLVLGLALSCFAINHVNAQQQVQVSFENLQPSDGFYLTPVFAGFHDGSFDIFEAGTAASASLEAIAEDGMVGGLQADFTANGVGQQTVFTNAAGFAGAPVLDPGEVATQVFGLTTSSRYLNFATMLIPTNDSFLGNDVAIEILDSLGNFTGSQTIDFTFADIWDAGTEVNDTFGIPFTPAVGTSTDENGVVSQGQNLANLDGIATAAGTNINFSSASNSPFLRLTITAVPEPSSLALFGVCGLAAVIRRRR